jgi:hypothetical protein
MTPMQFSAVNLLKTKKKFVIRADAAGAPLEKPEIKSTGQYVLRVQRIDDTNWAHTGLVCEISEDCVAVWDWGTGSRAYMGPCTVSFTCQAWQGAVPGSEMGTLHLFSARESLMTENDIGKHDDFAGAVGGLLDIALKGLMDPKRQR